MTSQPNLSQMRRTVGLRLLVFHLFYLTLLFFTTALAVLMSLLDLFIIFNWFDLIDWLKAEYGLRERLTITLSVLLVFLTYQFLAHIYSLVRFVFTQTTSAVEDSSEFTERQNPELFRLVRAAASSVHADLPSSVFIRTDARILLTARYSFRHFFKPVACQLHIGLGLLQGLSSAELKGLLIREFAYVALPDNATDRFLQRMLQLLHAKMHSADRPDYFRHLTYCVYRYTQRGSLLYLRHISQQADRVACSGVGKENFISALCKADLLERRIHSYDTLLDRLLVQQRAFPDYWQGYRLALPYLEQQDAVSIRYDVQFRRPYFTPQQLPLHVRLHDVWQVDRALADRIHDLELNVRSSENVPDQTDAASLLSDHEWAQFGSLSMQSFIPRQCHPVPPKYLTAEEFQAVVSAPASSGMLPAALVPFFDRDFYSAVPEEQLVAEAPATTAPESNPFTLEHLTTLRCYEAAQADLELLRQVKAGTSEAREVVINGSLSDRKHLPFGSLGEEVNHLSEKAAAIDVAVFRYLCSHSTDPQSVVQAYVMMRYALPVVRFAESYLPRCQEVEIIYRRVESLKKKLKKDHFKEISTEFKEVEKILHTLLGMLDYTKLSACLNPVSIAYLRHLSKYRLEIDDLVNTESLYVRVRIICHLYQLHQEILQRHYSFLIGLATEALPEADHLKLLSHIQAQTDFVQRLGQTGQDKLFLDRIKRSRNLLAVLYSVLLSVLLFFSVYVVGIGALVYYYFATESDVEEYEYYDEDSEFYDSDYDLSDDEINESDE